MNAGTTVRYRPDGAIARVTLDRPERRNALDAATVRELTSALDRAEQDSAVRLILLQGAGRDFCAGADLAELAQRIEGSDAVADLADAAAFGQLFVRMRRSPRIIVAAVHGHALAGGAGLATAADLILAADDARFGYPEVHIGFVPAIVMALLRRIVGEKVALELILRGEPIDAREAQRIGLVNRVFAVADFEGAVDRYAAELAARPAAALLLAKRLFYGIDNVAFEDAIARGVDINALARQTDECRAGVRSFLKRQGS